MCKGSNNGKGILTHEKYQDFLKNKEMKQVEKT